MSDPRSGRAAFVEDVNPETGEADPESRKSANSGAKRSTGSLKKESLAPSGLPNDSAVSELSNAGKASVRSSSPTKPAARSSRKTDEDRAPVKRRATVSERDRERGQLEGRDGREREREEDREWELERQRRKESKRDARHRSPEKSTRKSFSGVRRDGSCEDPNCRECQFAAREYGPRAPPLDTRMDINYPPFTSTTGAMYGGGPTSAYPVQHDSYGQPIGSRPRNMSYAGTGRPLSYHAYYASSSPVVGPHSGISQGFQAGLGYDAYSSRQSYFPSQSSQLPTPQSRAPVRTALAGTMPDDSFNYSARASGQSMPQVPTYRHARQPSRDIDDFDITTRPTRTRYQAPPGAFPESDTSESSPERPLMTDQRRRRDSQAMPPPERPPIRHAATTSDALPRRSSSQRDSMRPLLVQEHRSYDQRYSNPSDNYQSDRSTQAVINRSGYDADSRRSERSYRTYNTDPYTYGRKERDLSYDPTPGRRMSVSGQSSRFHQREADVQNYQDQVRGSREEYMTADTLRRIQRNSIGAYPPPQTTISNGSHHSHRSRQSISSRTSGNGGMKIQYGENILLNVGQGHSVSLVDENGRSLLVVGGPSDLHRETSYVAERSVRSSAHASSGGHSSRSRAESSSARGRRNSVRPDQRRQSEHSGDASYERSL